MQIVVCVKQVPDTNEVKIDPETNTLMRQGVPSIVNPFDKIALEAGLRLKETYGGRVTAISMGPTQAKEALRECLAMGADEAILISDRAFGGADTLATSYTLASAIRKLESFDIILCGKQAIDGDTAQVGPEIAENLNIAQITCVSKIDLQDDLVKAEREHEDGIQVIETKLPVLLTITKTLNYEPRYLSSKKMKKFEETEIPVWTMNDLDVEEMNLGLKGSPTQVRKIFGMPKRTNGILIQKENSNDAVAELIKHLSDAKII